MNKNDVPLLRSRLWALLGVAGGLIHVGTAILRLDTFFPRPYLLDFGAFYAAAWAVRLEVPPYGSQGLTAEFLETLRTGTDLFFRPPLIFNPPIWPWLLQPFTLFGYPLAGVLWLLLQLLLLAWSTRIMADLAGWTQRWQQLVLFLLVVSFGPVFLTLTLGQNSLFALIAALLVGQTLRSQRDGARCSIPAAVTTGLAIAARIFPLTWPGAVLLLRRRQLFLLLLLATLLVLGLPFMFMSTEINRAYWLQVLPDRVSRATEQASIDDQSLAAFLDRLGRSHTYRVPGLSVQERHTVDWAPPWSFDPAHISGAGYLLTILLSLAPLFFLLHADHDTAAGAFYLFVLWILLLLPHIERYNHVLLLPAMAWLWAQNRWSRTVVIGAYFLAGLSRLNHLWVLLLPAPWGPLATGFGLYAVLLLGAGLIVSLRQQVTYEDIRTLP